MPFLYRIVALLAVLAPLFAAPVNAQAPERRFALVIGNGEYKAGRQPTAANDAGLIAETLRTAGFDVAGARDLDQDTLRRSIREFLDKVSGAGPQAVAVVYLAGYGLQFEGENYFVPIDASIRRDEDIPIEAIRISDFTRPLAGTPGPVKVFIVDAARQHPFTPAGPPLASGLALVEPDPGMLIAFNAAPGSIASIENGPYGAFAQALSEMIGTGGLGLDDLFARVRLRVNEKTNGIAVPWYASKIAQPFLFTERAPDAPPPPQVTASMELQSRPIREFNGDQEAYAAALERDTLGGYEEFVGAYPDSPLTARVRALIAVRREAVTWRRTVSINTSDAYWSYLQRYPQGAHVADAQRRLARLAAAYDPPPAFTPMAFADVEPPPPDEVVYLSQPVVVFDGPGFLPPPPPPVFFLPPPPAFFVLAPPPPPIGAFFLPVPVIAFGVDRPWVRPPAFVQVPPRVPIQQITINNTTIINQRVGGAAAPLSAPLPAAVVTRVNSGALKPPPPAPPPPAPIQQSAALTGTGSLGKPTTLPARPNGPGATTTTAVPPAAAVPPGPVRPGSPAAATTAVPPAAAVPPGPPRPGSPAAATTAVPPAGAVPPGPPRPGSPAATTAVPPAGAVHPGPPRPGSPAAATTAVPPAGAVPPGPPRPGSPAAATTAVPPAAAVPPGPPRPGSPAAATTAMPPAGAVPPGPPRPGSPAAATTAAPPPAGAVPPGPPHPGPATATTTTGVPPAGAAPSGQTPPGTRPGTVPPARQITSPPPQAPPPRAPQVVNRPPPPAAPPPPAVRPPPPPPPVARAAPPPPPPPAARPAPPPPPPHIAPPPPAARAAPPPPQAAARPAPAPAPAAARKCVVKDGKQVCS